MTSRAAHSARSPRVHGTRPDPRRRATCSRPRLTRKFSRTSSRSRRPRSRPDSVRRRAVEPPPHRSALRLELRRAESRVEVASIAQRDDSTFSCDIAYSDRPTASRASARLRKPSALTTFPSRTVKTQPIGESSSIPLPRPRALTCPRARTRSPRSRNSLHSFLTSSKLSNESATHLRKPSWPDRRFPRHRRRSPSEARPPGRRTRAFLPRRLPRRAGSPRHTDGPAPRSPATSPAQYPAGSGVGVSVLLRQAHGFEGLGSVRRERSQRVLCHRVARTNVRHLSPGPARDLRAAVLPTSVARVNVSVVACPVTKFLGLTVDEPLPAPRNDCACLRTPRAAVAARGTVTPSGLIEPRRRPQEPHASVEHSASPSSPRAWTSTASPPPRRLKPRSQACRTISTFSCDIARAVSRRLRSRRERLTPTGRGLRERARCRSSRRASSPCRRGCGGDRSPLT